jgi:hypothetical protein
VSARLGDGEKALKELERNYEERSPLATLVNVDPASDSLRSDPLIEGGMPPADVAARFGVPKPW